LEVGIEVEADASLFGGVTATQSSKFTASYTNTNTEGHEHGTSWNDETSGENSNTYDKGNAFENNHSISTSDGDILVSAKVSNTGNVAYTLNNLYLNASYFNRSADRPNVPIGSLQFDDPTSSQFPAVTLAPGQATGVMTFKTSPLNVDTVKNLLKDSRGMTIEPSIYDMLDQNGQSYVFASTGISTQTALVKVDYIGNGGRKNITKRVAVHGNPGHSITVEEVLNNLLNINAVVTDIYGAPSASGVISSIDGLANSEPEGYWIMMHGKNLGNDNITTTTYTTPDDKTRWLAKGKVTEAADRIIDDYDLSQITLGGGDILHLFYMQDSDLDGVPNVQEFFYGTDPMAADTDQDGLDDGLEVRGWDVEWQDENMSQQVARVYPSPTVIDTDGDGLTDDIEANVTDPYAYNRRNPETTDTDSDGILDNKDDLLNPVTPTLGQNTFDSLQIKDVYAVVSGVAPPFDLYSYFTFPASLSGMGTNGYNTYDVAVFRLVSVDGKFSEPANAPLDQSPVLLGDTLPAEDGVSVWLAIDTYSATAASANVQYAVYQPAILGAGSGKHAKIIVFANIDGHWLRMDRAAIASAETESITFTMLPGTIRNKKLVVGPGNNARPDAFIRHDSTDPLWFYVGNGQYEQVMGNLYKCTTIHSGCGPRYTRYDSHRGDQTHDVHLGSDDGQFERYTSSRMLFSKDIGGNDIHTVDTADYWAPPMVYPFANGDGNIDLGWNLGFDGNRFYKANANAAGIANTRQTWRIDNTNNPMIAPRPTTRTVDGLEIFTSAVSSSGQTGAWTIAVPATSGCHRVWGQILEWDMNIRDYNPPSDWATTIELCRDNSPKGFGVWTATLLRKDGLRTPVGATRPGNINPITVNLWEQWHDIPPADRTQPYTIDGGANSAHAVTNEFDLDFGYTITVN